MARVLRRSFARATYDRALWNGNREGFADWLDAEHPVRWAWAQHGPRRAQVAARVAGRTADMPAVVRLRTPAQARRWLARVTVGPGRAQARSATKIAVPGSSRPRSGDQPPQTWSPSRRPLRLDDVQHDEPGARPAPGRGRRASGGARRTTTVAVGVGLDVRAPVEVAVASRSAPAGPGRRGRPSGPGGAPRTPSVRRAAAPGPPRGAGRRSSATNGSAPYAEQARSNEPATNGSAAASAWTAGTRTPVRASRQCRLGQLAGGQVDARRPVRPGRAASASTGAAPAPTSSTRRPADRPEQAARRPRRAPPGPRRSGRRRGTRRARPGRRRPRRPTRPGLARRARRPRASGRSDRPASTARLTLSPAQT